MDGALPYKVLFELFDQQRRRRFEESLQVRISSYSSYYFRVTIRSLFLSRSFPPLSGSATTTPSFSFPGRRSPGPTLDACRLLPQVMSSLSTSVFLSFKIYWPDENCPVGMSRHTRISFATQNTCRGSRKTYLGAMYI